jgi:hypothetical protein
MTFPTLYVTEHHHMLRSEDIQKRTTPRASSRPKEPAKRISGVPLRCGSIDKSPMYQSVSQRVDGCNKTARKAVAKPFTVGGRSDIWRSLK